MKRKTKKQHLPTGEMFEYSGRFFKAMAHDPDDKDACKLCAFGKPKSNDDYRAHGCKDHVCELSGSGVFFVEVK